MDTVVRLGQACHITAASEMGPRHNRRLSVEERTAIGNGIWLCNLCAKEIDADRKAFPVRLLRQWKADAESHAREQQGKRHPHPDDAVQTLAAAFTGQAPRFMPSAITNVHNATQTVLSALDPRFRVESSYVNNAPALTIHPVAAATISFLPPEERSSEWQKAFESVIDHGAEVTIPMDGATITGSPLFEKLFDTRGVGGATLAVWTPPAPAVQYTALVDSKTGERTQLPDFHGQITFGTKSYTVELSACDGILSMRFQRQWDSTKGSQMVTLNTGLERWEGCDVRRLPHFETLRRIFDRIVAGCRFNIELEVDGQPFVRTVSKDIDREIEMLPESVRHNHWLLEYVADLRTLADRLGTSILYRNEVPITHQDRKGLVDAVMTFERKMMFRKEQMPTPPSFTVVVGDDSEAIRLFKSDEPGKIFKIVEPDGRKLNAFGQEVILPLREILISNVTPILSVDPCSVRPGDTVSVELHPTESFVCEYVFAVD